MPPKRDRGKAKTQSKNFVVLSPYKFKELLENGTIKLESAHIDVSRIQKPEYVPVTEPEVNFSILDSEHYIETGNSIDESNYKYEYEDHDNDFSDNIVNTADQEVPTLKKWKESASTKICLECNKEFLSYLNLKRHYIDHHPHTPVPEKFICKEEHCTFKTDDNDSFSKHKRVHKPSGSGSHKSKHRSLFNRRCTECNIPFKFELGLKIHVNFIHRKLPLNCPVCQHLSTTFSGLKQHIRIHEIEEPFRCEQCDATFTLKQNKMRHVELVHNKERRFECEECGKRFGQKISMQLHFQTVHLKIPYLPWVNKKKNRKRKLELKQDLDLAE